MVTSSVAVRPPPSVTVRRKKKAPAAASVTEQPEVAQEMERPAPLGCETMVQR